MHFNFLNCEERHILYSNFSFFWMLISIFSWILFTRTSSMSLSVSPHFLLSDIDFLSMASFPCDMWLRKINLEKVHSLFFDFFPTTIFYVFYHRINFSTAVRIFLLLWEFLYWCENISLIAKIFCLMWEFFAWCENIFPQSEYFW